MENMFAEILPKLVDSGASVLLLGFIIYQVMNRVIPAAMDKHTETIDRIIAEHTVQIKKMQDSHKSDMETQRESHKKSEDKIISVFEKTLNTYVLNFTNEFKKYYEENRKLHEENLKRVQELEAKSEQRTSFFTEKARQMEKIMETCSIHKQKLNGR